MKKQTLLLLACIFFVETYAQVDNTTDATPYFAKHEIKVNALYMVLGAADFSYEYLLSEESGLGINVLLPLDEDVKEDVQYYILPYYRFYFGKKYAAGFFLEAFGVLNSIEPEVSIERNDYVTDFALGFGLGGKWVTKGGFVGQIGLGVGRNLFNTEDSIDFFSKIDITLGYRF